MKKTAKILAVLLAVVMCASALTACPKSAKLTGIAVTTPPNTLTYTVGQTFDKTGMVVTATYSDESTKPVTNYKFSPSGALKDSDKTVTISYSEGLATKTTEIAILIVPQGTVLLSGIEIAKGPNNTEYIEGDAFNPAGIEVKATYSDGSSKTVTTGFVCSPSGPLAAGTTVITVSYTENGVTKTAVVNITVADGGDLPVYSAATIAKIAEFVGALLAEVPVEGAPDWWFDILEDGAGMLINILKRARISDGELTALIGVFEGFDWYDLDPYYYDGPWEYISLLTGLINDFYGTGITHTKIAAFLWGAIVTGRELYQTVYDWWLEAAEEEFDEEYIEYFTRVMGLYFEMYDALLDAGEKDFRTIIVAMLDLAKLSLSFESLLHWIASGETDGPPTLNEFTDIVFELKANALAALDILNADTLKAIINLARIFMPYAAEADFGDGYLLSQIARYEDNIYWRNKNIEYYYDTIDWCEEMIKNDPDNKEYYLEEIEWQKQYIEWAEEDIEEYEAKIARLEGLLGTDYMDKLIGDINKALDEAVKDYAKLLVSVKAALNAINAPMLEAVYNAIIDEDQDAGIIIVAKLINAGIKASGGINEVNSKEIYKKYIQMFLDADITFIEIFDELNYLLVENTYYSLIDGRELSFNEIFDEIIEHFAADVAVIAALNYNAELGKEYDNNLLVLAFYGGRHRHAVGTFAAYYFYVEYLYEYEYGSYTTSRYGYLEDLEYYELPEAVIKMLSKFVGLELTFDGEIKTYSETEREIGALTGTIYYSGWDHMYFNAYYGDSGYYMYIEFYMI